MLRKIWLLSFLALSTASVGCLDDDPEQTTKKSGEDESDLDNPTDREGDAPIGCRVSLQQDEEDPDCTPKP